MDSGSLLRSGPRDYTSFHPLCAVPLLLNLRGPRLSPRHSIVAIRNNGKGRTPQRPEGRNAHEQLMASYMFNRPNLLKEGQQSSDCKQPKSSGDNKEGQKSGRFNEPGKRVTPFNGHPSRYESATQRAGEHKYTVYDRLICNTPSPLWRGHCIKDEISSCQVKTRPEDSAIELDEQNKPQLRGD